MSEDKPEWLKAFDKWVLAKKREVEAAQEGRRSQAYDIFVVGGKRYCVHARKNCRGKHCVIHNPSDHHMVGWPVNFRSDRGIVERICPCGVGHPDPDDLAYRKTQGRADGVHGCCGCCAEGGDA